MKDREAKQRWGTRQAGRGGRESQERPWLRWPEARDLQVDSRGPGGERKAGEHGGAQTIGPAGGREPGAGRERSGGERGPGTRQPPQAPPPPLTDSASSPHSSRAVRGRAGARQGGQRGPRLRLLGRRPGREQEPREPGPRRRVGPEEAREEEGSEPSSPLGGRYHHRCHRRCRRRRPALTRRRPGTSAARDAPEAGWATSRDTGGLGSLGTADWRMFRGRGFGPGWAAGQ